MYLAASLKMQKTRAHISLISEENYFLTYFEQIKQYINCTVSREIWI